MGVRQSYNRHNDCSEREYYRPTHSIGEVKPYIIDKRFNHNKAAFARAVEISPTTLASYLNPKKASKPTSDFLCDVVEKLGINAVWLLTGQGEMEEKQKPQGDDVDCCQCLPYIPCNEECY